MKKIIVLFICVFTSAVNATVIDFDGFSGTFTGGVEDGFTVAVNGGSDLVTDGALLGAFSGLNSLRHFSNTSSGITIDNAGGVFVFANLQVGLTDLFGGAGPRLSKRPCFIVIILLLFGFHLKNS